MERGDFHGYRKLSPSTLSGSKPPIPDTGMRIPELNHANTNNSLPAPNNSVGDDECTVREQDRFMPIANVIRIMRRILPPHGKISDDAKETMQDCVSEYISFITGEANERCQREQRKTITAEDILWAMSKLGFDDYIEPLTIYLHRYRELEGERGNGCNGGSIRSDHMMVLGSGLVMKRANGTVAADYGAYGPGLHLAHYQHHNYNNHMNHENGFLFGGYNSSFKNGAAKVDASFSATAAAPVVAPDEVPPYKQHKF